MFKVLIPDNTAAIVIHPEATNPRKPEPSEWLAMMSDPLLAQSAVDRLVSTAHELVIEGDSYRRRQKPTHATKTDANTGVSVDQQKGDHHAH